MKLRHRVAITRGPGRRCRNSEPEDQPSVVRNSQQNTQRGDPLKQFQGIVVFHRRKHSQQTHSTRTSKKKLRGRLDSHIAKTTRQRVHDDERGSGDELLSVDWTGQSNSMLGDHTTAMTLSNRFLVAALLTQVACVWACSSHS